LDTTGANCREKQSGAVWFLAGTFGGPVTRNCTISSGKAILFPVLNSIFGAAVGDCTGPADCNVNQLRAGAAANMDGVYGMAASLDGTALPDPKDFRAASPTFNIVFPFGAIFGFPKGNFKPNVSDGYWMMLRPLSLGTHILYFHGNFADGSAVDVTYNLSIR